MATLQIKPQDQNEYEISNSCIADFNNLSQQRQKKILKQLNINGRSFVQHVANEKKMFCSDIKEIVEDTKRECQTRESNAKQIERKYGEIIQDLYADETSVKIIATNLAKLDQAENADSKLKISPSIIRAVINSLGLQRADDRKKGKNKTKKKNSCRPARVKTDVPKVTEQMTEIESAGDKQIEKQIDSEIENVQLDDLGTESDT